MEMEHTLPKAGAWEFRCKQTWLGNMLFRCFFSLMECKSASFYKNLWYENLNIQRMQTSEWLQHARKIYFQFLQTYNQPAWSHRDYSIFTALQTLRDEDPLSHICCMPSFLPTYLEKLCARAGMWGKGFYCCFLFGIWGYFSCPETLKHFITYKLVTADIPKRNLAPSWQDKAQPSTPLTDLRCLVVLPIDNVHPKQRSSMTSITEMGCTSSPFLPGGADLTSTMHWALRQVLRSDHGQRELASVDESHYFSISNPQK